MMIAESNTDTKKIPGQEVAEDNWTEIIRPQSSLFNLNLQEVWRYRDLLMLFVKRDIASQYRQTILGPLWHIIQPIFTTIMFLILFNKIAGISTDALPPTLFYMSSIAIWNYFSSCLSNTSNTFVANAGIFGKVYFPRLVLPLSSIISNMVKFGIQFGILLVMMAYYAFAGIYTPQFGWHTLLLPVIIVLMGAIGLGTGIIISSLTTKYRDLTILIGFGVGLFMYVTPVAYPLSYLEQSKYKQFIEWNPLTPLIEGFRYAVFGTGTFSTGFFLYSIACAFLLLLWGIMIFNKVERSFMDTV
jgi:lipopolysaccharide transport system permease protein